MPGSGIDKIQKNLKDEYINEKTKLKNTNYGPAVVYQDNEKTAPARVRQQMPTGGDGTAYYGEEVIDEKIGAFVQKGMKALSKVPIRKMGVASVGLGAITGVGAAIKSALDKRREKKISQDVDKYVSDRQLKGGPKKVEYKPTNQYTVTRDDKGKVTGTGKLIRVQPGTRTTMRMPEPGERTSVKSRFSQYTGSPFKASPLNKNKAIYGMQQEAAVSQQQQKFMGMVYAYKKGEMPNASDEVKKAAEGMTMKEVEKYASTKHAKLPKKIEEKLDKNDVPVIKGIIKKLEGASEKHKNQSIALKKAVEENTAIESELTIQDWNSDDIKFTEIETVDIIKAKPLKESMSNWREDLGEDWQKENRKDKTDGLSRKAVKAYRRENPGSKLKTAVTKDPKKLKKGSKSAKRRLSFCRRMKGMKKKLTSAKTSRDPDSRINKALRRWNC